MMQPTTGRHGLQRQAEQKLTADFILLKALEHAAANDGKLPSQHSGEVIGMPGQTWRAWQIAVFRKKRGFNLTDINGLGALYNYGSS